MKADVAIITTREDEFETVLQRFKPIPYREPGQRSYGICHLETKGGNHYTIAIARCSEQGNDTSQQLAHDMIHDLDPRLILVVGIAGGVPHDEFTLGDVIVSTRIHNLNVGAQHEDGSSTFDIRGGIHPAISDITSSFSRTAIFREAKCSLFWNWRVVSAHRSVSPGSPAHRSPERPRRKVSG